MPLTMLLRPQVGPLPNRSKGSSENHDSEPFGSGSRIKPGRFRAENARAAGGPARPRHAAAVRGGTRRALLAPDPLTDLPLPTAVRGVPRADDRRVISGIVQVLQSGCRWADLPACHGPRTTLCDRFVRRAARDVWQKIFLELAATGDHRRG